MSPTFLSSALQCHQSQLQETTCSPPPRIQWTILRGIEGGIKASLVLGEDECLGLWGTELGTAPKGRGAATKFGSRFLFLWPHQEVALGGVFLCLTLLVEIR